MTSRSSRGGENDGSSKWGGCGKRDREKVEGVGSVCAWLECECSDEKLNATGSGERRRCVDFTFAKGVGNTGPVAAGGLGSLFLELKLRTLPDELVVTMLDMLPPCTRGSADCDRNESVSSACCSKGA